MDTVFVVRAGTAPDSSIVGIFTTTEGAAKCVEREKNEDRRRAAHIDPDSPGSRMFDYTIEEVKLNEVVWV
jgi:hypothetical protein